jgi:hypothetical protein
MAAYQLALNEAPPPNYSGHATGTMGRLVIDFLRSTEFANLKPSSQKNYKLILDKLRAAHGHRLVRTSSPQKPGR